MITSPCQARDLTAPRGSTARLQCDLREENGEFQRLQQERRVVNGARCSTLDLRQRLLGLHDQAAGLFLVVGSEAHGADVGIPGAESF